MVLPLTKHGWGAVLQHEYLFALLPSEGDWISRHAAHAALEERLAVDIDDHTFDRCVWQLGESIVWSPHENLYRRRLPEDLAPPPDAIASELDLEPWFERFIWKKALQFFYDPPPHGFNVIVQNTARGGMATGRWTRPDLCAACISRYHYTPVPQFDLFSFELKMPSGCNMLAVHEALAHSATAHFPYLCAYLPEDARERVQLPNMLEQSQRHGVGVIVMTDPRDFETYKLALVARRNSPSPAKIDGFIDDRFDEANRLALQKWIRR
jgi:hypothetical protein